MKGPLALLSLLGLALSSPSSFTQTETYSGHQVFSCPLSSRLQVDSLYELVHAFGLDVWAHRHPSHTSSGLTEVDLRLTPSQIESPFLSSWLEPRCSLVIPDVGAHLRGVEEEWRASSAPQSWFEDYHTYEEIVAWYRDLARAYPDLSTFVESIGRSFEGRNQPAFHFTSPKGGADKPKIYWQCQIHAREWISGATCSYVVNHFLENYGRSDNITALMDGLEFVVVPFTNPDGYAYTWSNERLWRKNRQPNSGSTCVGVDLNRNYNSHWGQGGSSTNPCSDTFMGPSPNSAPETQNTINKFRASAPVIGAIDWHSYGQLILRPWGYSRTNAPDETFLKSVGDGIRSAILSSGGVAYTSQKSIDLYTTTGTASDWFYDDEATSGNKGYRAAGFTLELRDTGRYGFLLPPSEIIPNGQEMVAAAIYFCERVLAAPLRA